MKNSLYFLMLSVSSCAVAIAAEVPVAEYETTPAVWWDVQQGAMRYSDGIAEIDCLGQRASVADTEAPFFECGVKDGWFGVVAPWIVFSFDVSWSRLPERWKRGGYIYSVVSSRIDGEFGSLERIAAYSVSEQDDIFTIDFSFVRGVVGFEHLDSEQNASESFRLVGGSGLGANPKPEKPVSEYNLLQ